MVDILSMVDLTSISAMLAAIGVTVGVVFAILQLRDLVKTRQTDLVMRLYSTFGSKEFQGAWINAYYWEFKDYNDFVKKYARDTKMASETWVSFNSMAAFFEGIGVLLRRRLIDIRLVDDLFSTPIKQTWELTKPIIEASVHNMNVLKYGSGLNTSTMKCKNEN